jgi:hypothetical protein
MSPSALTPCPACNRHVRAAETRCPFCDAEQPARALDGAASVPRKRLGRAALMTAGVLLGTAEACGDSLQPTDAGSNSDTGAMNDTGGNDGGPVALYGAPAPEYGVPPPATQQSATPAASTAAKPVKT